jgi:hypothetical protein
LAIETIGIPARINGRSKNSTTKRARLVYQNSCFQTFFPYSASIIGKPKEVFPKPAVRIKQPINFLDHPNRFPKTLKQIRHYKANPSYTNRI